MFSLKKQPNLIHCLRRCRLLPLHVFRWPGTDVSGFFGNPCGIHSFFVYLLSNVTFLYAEAVLFLCQNSRVECPVYPQLLHTNFWLYFGRVGSFVGLFEVVPHLRVFSCGIPQFYVPFHSGNTFPGISEVVIVGLRSFLFSSVGFVGNRRRLVGGVYMVVRYEMLILKFTLNESLDFICLNVYFPTGTQFLL